VYLRGATYKGEGKSGGKGKGKGWEGVEKGGKGLTHPLSQIPGYATVSANSAASLTPVMGN